MSAHPVRPSDRAFAIVGLIAVVGLTWIALVVPAQNWLAQIERRLAEEAALSVRLANMIGAGKQALSANPVESLQSRRPIFLQTGRDGLVIAGLQQKLTAIGAENDIEVSSARALPPVAIDNQIYLGLRLQLRGDLKPLHAWLYAVETATPYLFVERAHLRLEDPYIAGKTRQSSSARMVAELDVYAAKWTDPSTSSAGEAQ